MTSHNLVCWQASHTWSYALPESHNVSLITVHLMKMSLEVLIEVGELGACELGHTAARIADALCESSWPTAKHPNLLHLKHKGQRHVLHSYQENVCTVFAL